MSGSSEYSPENIYNLLWSKSNPMKTMIQHMIEVGAQAQVLLTEGCMVPVANELASLFQCTLKDAISFTGYIAAMHDIGKCHPLFQQKAIDAEIMPILTSLQMTQMNTGQNFRHEKYSEIIFSRLIKAMGMKSRSTNMAATTLRLHHQGKHGDGSEPSSERLRSFWQTQQNSINSAMLALFKPDLTILNWCSNQDSAGVLISGLIILADWLSSGQPEFSLLQAQDKLYDYYHQSQSAAQHAIVNCGLGRRSPLPATYHFSDLWHGFSEPKIRPVQKTCMEACKSDVLGGLYILEAPMGEGKTEAALYLAAHLMKAFGKEGFYVALPTSATSNQMHSRVEHLLKDHGIGHAQLLHSLAWQLDDCTSEGRTGMEDAEDAAKWLAPLRRGMLSSYAVGTIDQAMLAVMMVKYGFLRLMGLANKVLILDEVHAYDAYMSTIIERLLAWCSTLHVPVILLSATLPDNKREALIRAYGGIADGDDLYHAYPLISSVQQDGQVCQWDVGDTYIKRSVSIHKLPLLGKWEEVAALALDKVSNGGCLCILVNTVKEAQNLYQAVKGCNHFGQDIWLKLFHARFTADQRKLIEDECLLVFGKENGKSGDIAKRPHRAILVATQVVEQSLDIDFDEMISAIAPIDLLLQRMGRLHRHDGRKRPQSMGSPSLTILMPPQAEDYGNTQYVYAPWILNKTLEMISGMDVIRVPQDLRRLVEAVYDARVPDTDSQDFQQWYKMLYDEQFSAGMARSCMLPLPDEESFFCTQQSMQLFDEDGMEGSYTTAKTRLGEDSVKIALLGHELFTEISTQQADNGFPRKDKAQQALWRSVSIQTKLISDIPSTGYCAPLEGRGLLKGVMLLNMVDGKYSFTTKTGTIAIRQDNELGILVERG